MSMMQVENPSQQTPVVATLPPPASLEPGRVRRLVHLLWSTFVGMAMIQSLVTGVIALGWVMRVTRRSVLGQWWKDSPVRARGVGFEEFLAQREGLAHLSGPTPWFTENRALARVRRRRAEGGVARVATGLPRTLFHSLASNLGLGLGAFVNMSLVTLLPCALLAMGWYAGWDNSFRKGYEQFHVGPLLGWFGILGFALVMLYAPLAQARQAATGSFRAFWDLSVVRRLVQARWFACFALAMSYAVLALPVLALRNAPKFFPQIFAQSFPAATQWNDAQMLSFLQSYFFYAAAYVLIAFVVLRLAAGWIYASALRSCLARGTLTPDALAEPEVTTLTAFGLMSQPEGPRTHWLWRAMSWTGGKLALGVFTLASLLAWIGFSFQQVIGQFINALPPVQAWLQHPLIQVPWFHYIPEWLGG